ncbi:flagellar basal-body MS-ring/collar protein FliF [Luminiphilus sp.]|jgi:flagellar M-ring protein FliF|nr:flagellar basal-body MS-ring/collar protein FliF [Luminiphilus sp.]MDC0573750.1 flagellar basal-body MS-ring/collar protein FliF [Luminiphilus sp.]
MEAALEQRPLIEGSATEVDSTARPPAESGNAPAPAEQTAVTANQSAALPAMKDVMSQPAVKRAMPAIVGLLSLLVVLIFWSIMTSTPFRSVSDGFESADVQLAFEALKGANYDVRINKSTGRLEVPENDFQASRIFLASQGIPRAAADGGMGSLAEGSSMTTSQFMEQVKYNNAIEVELARTITEIGTIETARVHLAAPKQSVFVRDRQPAKASVIVKPYRGRVVDPAQVLSIVHLVSASVPYLATQDVTVVDHYGNLLTGSNADKDGTPALNNARFEAERETELAERIRELLIPALGGGNVRTVVNLEMDFTQRETTREQYLDLEGGGAEVRSEVITSDSQTGIAASGIPGGTTNIPPDQPEVVPEGEVAANPANTETATTEREQTTRNYELDKEITFVKEQAGRVVSMTAGVIVNEEALRDLAKRRYYASLDEQPLNTGDLLDGEPTEGDAGALEGAAATLAPIPSAELQRYMADELEQLRGLVLTALPYNAERGDALTIRSAPFFTDPPQDYQLPWHKDPAIIEWGRHGMTSIGLIAFFLLVIAPVLRVYMPKIEESDALLAEQLIDGELSIADRKALEEGESLDEIKAKLKPKKSAISADMLDTANSYDDKVAVVRLLVAEDAGRVANVLKKMIKPV